MTVHFAWSKKVEVVVPGSHLLLLVLAVFLFISSVLPPMCNVRVSPITCELPTPTAERCAGVLALANSESLNQRKTSRIIFPFKPDAPSGHVTMELLDTQQGIRLSCFMGGSAL